MRINKNRQKRTDKRREHRERTSERSERKWTVVIFMRLITKCYFLLKFKKLNIYFPKVKFVIVAKYICFITVLYYLQNM